MGQIRRFLARAMQTGIRTTNYIRKMFATFTNRLLVPNCGPHTVFMPGTRIIGGGHINIGSRVIIRRRCTIAAQTEYFGQKIQSSVTIGDGVDLGEDCLITAANRIVIGENTLTGRMVTITDNSHGDTSPADLSKAPHKRPVISKGEVIIGKNVWIGDKATILPDVHIGEGAVIAANAVVTKDVPAYCIAAGVPARIIRQVQ